MTAETIPALTRQVIRGTPLSREQAEWLVQTSSSCLHDLFRGASRIREAFHGHRIHCCSIVASKVGQCGEDCAFCSQSAHYVTSVPERTVLSGAAIRSAARDSIANGASSFGLVNSGRGPTDLEIEHWREVIRELQSSVPLVICASFGVLRDNQIGHLAEAGVRRYNHNLQTSRRFFPNIIKTHSYDDRLNTLKALKAAGVELCSGALFGMGETWPDRLDLAFELRDLEPAVVPINFLIRIPGTPLERYRPLSPMECLKAIAIYRFLLPRQDIKIAGGREVNLRNCQGWIFYAGASSFLIGNYLTTCGRSPDSDRRLVADLGLTLEQRSNSQSPSCTSSGARHVS